MWRWWYSTGKLLNWKQRRKLVILVKTRRQKCLCIIVYFWEEERGEGNFVSTPVLCIKMNKLLSAIFFLNQLL